MEGLVSRTGSHLSKNVLIAFKQRLWVLCLTRSPLLYLPILISEATIFLRCCAVHKQANWLIWGTKNLNVHFARVPSTELLVVLGRHDWLTSYLIAIKLVVRKVAQVSTIAISLLILRYCEKATVPGLALKGLLWLVNLNWLVVDALVKVTIK